MLGVQCGFVLDHQSPSRRQFMHQNGQSVQACRLPVASFCLRERTRSTKQWSFEVMSLLLFPSGMALVRALTDGFVWIDKNLPDSFPFRESCVRVFRRFAEVC